MNAIITGLIASRKRSIKKQTAEADALDKVIENTTNEAVKAALTKNVEAKRAYVEKLKGELESFEEAQAKGY